MLLVSSSGRTCCISSLKFITYLESASGNRCVNQIALLKDRQETSDLNTKVSIREMFELINCIMSIYGKVPLSKIIFQYFVTVWLLIEGSISKRLWEIPVCPFIMDQQTVYRFPEVASHFIFDIIYFYFYSVHSRIFIILTMHAVNPIITLTLQFFPGCHSGGL